MIRGSWAANWQSVSTRGTFDLGYGYFKLVIAHRQVMPIEGLHRKMSLRDGDSLLHVGNSLTENRFGQDDSRSFAVCGHRGGQIGDGMAIHFRDLPSESLPSLRQVRAIHHVTSASEGLLAVPVQDDAEIRKLMVSRKHDGLPGGSLVAFGVAQEAKDTPRRSLQARGQRRARRET